MTTTEELRESRRLETYNRERRCIRRHGDRPRTKFDGSQEWAICLRLLAIDAPDEQVYCSAECRIAERARQIRAGQTFPKPRSETFDDSQPQTLRR
jgi:hypothetical protein